MQKIDKASVKNFQLVESKNEKKVEMQFGRNTEEDLFVLDVGYPFSIFQAFTIALSSLDFKISVR